MDYGPKKLMKGDVLWFLRVMIIDIFKLRVVLGGLFALLMFHFILFIVQCYCFLVEPRLFPKYGPQFMGNLYAMSAGVIVFWKKRIVETMWDSFDRWDISSASPLQERKISRDVRLLLILIAINNSIGLTVGILMVIPGSYDEDFFFIPFIVLRWFPFLRRYSTLVTFSYKLSVATLSYLMMVQPYMVVYAIQHAKFQIELGMFYATNVESGFEGIPDDVLAVSVVYQGEMNKRIMFNTKRHNEVYSWGLSLRREVTGTTFAILALFGFLLGISVLLIFIQLEQYGNSRLLISWVVLFSVTAIITFASLIYSGQLIQDEVESIERELTQVKWYVWNCENRKLFMRSQGAFLVPFKLSFSGKYAINYDLAVGMLKGLYSFTSLFVSMVEH